LKEKLVDITRILQKVFPKLQAVPPEVLKDPRSLSPEDIKLIGQMGLTYGTLGQSFQESIIINFERTAIYRDIDRATSHWAMAAAGDLFAEVSTNFNQRENSSVWITSTNTKYQKVLTKFLEDIGIEERIYDWAYTTGVYGDLLVEVNGEPGLGIISVDDSAHPANISRTDYGGVLLGFYTTPFEGGGGGMMSVGECDLIPPWKVVHFRLLGVKKKRPVYDDPSYTEYRTTYLMGGETKQLSSRYGTSLLFNGLPVYKRLRLAEDSIQLARLTRGILRYIYKVKCSGSTAEASAEILKEYMNTLKHARAIDTGDTTTKYENKMDMMSVMEDLFIPVFNDAGDVTIEKIGGETDIRWIVDIEDLRNQLSCALRVPLPLLGGYTKDATGALGSEAIGKLGIRFARSARRLQRALCVGISRLCQIHLAYMGMDPDPTLFQVQMAETSTEEEEEMRDSLDKSTDAITKFMDMIDKAGSFDKVELLNYFNQKILKLSDLDMKKYLLPGGANVPVEDVKEKVEDVVEDVRSRKAISMDLYAPLPISEKNPTTVFQLKENWEKEYGTKKVVIKEKK
jgi:hypothetical protein